MEEGGAVFQLRGDQLELIYGAKAAKRRIAGASRELLGQCARRVSFLVL